MCSISTSQPVNYDGITSWEISPPATPRTISVISASCISGNSYRPIAASYQDLMDKKLLLWSSESYRHRQQQTLLFAWRILMELKACGGLSLCTGTGSVGFPFQRH